MPTYQYACTNPDCAERFERVQAFTDAAITECPVCGQAVRKVYGSVGVVFKGSGFYRTDSRSGSGSGSSSDGLAATSKDSGGGSDSGSGKESSSAKDSGSSKDSGASKNSGTSKDSGGSKAAATSSAASA